MRRLVVFLLLAGCSFDSGGGAPQEDSDVAGPDAQVQATQLIDRGLVARYFVDEGTDGVGSGVVGDATAEPVNLSIVAPEGAIEFAEAGGHRGILWSNMSAQDTVQAEIAGTKLSTRLDGANRFTLEVVVALVELNEKGTRYITIDDTDGGWGCVSLRSRGSSDIPTEVDDILLSTRRGPRSFWNVDLETRGRTLLQLVYDSSQAQEVNRARLFIDGVEQSRAGLEGEVDQDVGLDLSGCTHFGFGNKPDGTRGARQTVFYASVYSAALSTDEIAQNAAVLEQTDDR